MVCAGDEFGKDTIFPKEANIHLNQYRRSAIAK